MEKAGHLFISYSHLDRSYMRMFQKHLRGMLLDRVQVWSDQEITKGAEWRSLLKGNIAQASSALVLASPDYLVSPWCRREIKELAAAYRKKRLRNLFWIQLKPCGWQHTELADFQSFELNAEQAITEAADDIQRDRAILQACRQIATAVAQSVTEKDEHLAEVRRLLAYAPDRSALTVDEVLHSTPFSIICRGAMGSISACVKVMRHAPLPEMVKDFQRIGKLRKDVIDPAFVQILDLFPVESEEPRTFMVSNYLNNKTLLSDYLKRKTPFPPDRVAALLRRTASAIAELHRLGEKGKQWETTLGFITPDDVYYDEGSERLHIAPLGVCSFMWHVLDWGMCQMDGREPSLPAARAVRSSGRARDVDGRSVRVGATRPRNVGREVL